MATCLVQIRGSRNKSHQQEGKDVISEPTGTRSSTPGAIVDAYYECWSHGPGAFDETRLREILAPDLVFTGTLVGRRVGAEGFVKGVAGVAAVVRRHRYELAAVLSSRPLGLH